MPAWRDSWWLFGGLQAQQHPQSGAACVAYGGALWSKAISGKSSLFFKYQPAGQHQDEKKESRRPEAVLYRRHRAGPHQQAERMSRRAVTLRKWELRVELGSYKRAEGKREEKQGERPYIWLSDASDRDHFSDLRVTDTCITCAYLSRHCNRVDPMSKMFEASSGNWRASVYQAYGQPQPIQKHLYPLTPLAPRSANFLNIMSSPSSHDLQSQHDVPRKPVFKFDTTTPPSPPETPRSHRILSEQGQENASPLISQTPPIFQTNLADIQSVEVRSAAWMQPRRALREDLNPLVRTAEQRRGRRREEYLREGQRRRSDRAMDLRGDQILHTDALASWRAWQEEQERLGTEVAKEGEEDFWREEGRDAATWLDAAGDLEGRAFSDLPEPSIEELEELLLSQEQDLDNLVALHEQPTPDWDRPQDEVPPWNNTTTLPPSSQWGSDDDDFEAAMLQAVEGDEMDMSG
ncbi:hypothetical protein FH972_025854 [Carpinus fangiana]|uniref:Uncharacterized protein n=1 Tax=Carpinus fangiana TaxID=176857 RepID=A0A5N6L378_9ROSI|nr:hypothetical protein FH972_025854 [Carpinus fangiana]